MTPWPTFPSTRPAPRTGVCVARSGAGHRTGRRDRSPRPPAQAGPPVLAAPAAAGVWSRLGRHRAEDRVRAGLPAGGHLAVPPSGHLHHPPGPHRARGLRTRACRVRALAGPCTAVSCGDASRDSAATPSTPAAPGGSLRRPGLPFASPRSARPVSMTMRFCQDCDVPSCCRHWHVSESRYGYCPAATAKAWTRSGSSALRVRRHMDVLLSTAMGWRSSASRRLRQAMAGEALDATQGVGQPVLARHVPDEVGGVGAGHPGGRDVQRAGGGSAQHRDGVRGGAEG